MDFSNNKKNVRISWPDLILTDEPWSLHCAYFGIWIHLDCRRGVTRIVSWDTSNVVVFWNKGVVGVVGGLRFMPSYKLLPVWSSSCSMHIFCGTFFLFLLLPPYCFYCTDRSQERLVTIVTDLSHISFLFNIAVWECEVTGVKATSECLQKEPHRTTF